MDRIELISDLTCPECNNTSSEKMPTDCCLYYYRCKRCNTLLKPKEGDCCVFCSYGTAPCPPIQQGRSLTSQGGCGT